MHMPAKKASAAKKPSAVRKSATRRVGLTSAIGPKATTAVVICVLAGGLAVGVHQQSARANALRAVAEPLLAADTDVAPATSPSSPAKSSKPARAAASPEPGTEPAAATAKAAGVTITGCLERGDSGFRLTSTEGAAAPKSRSWKSGFLKKGSAAVDVVDPSHELALASQVGRRVSVTGTLVDREMHADAVRRVASSCKAG
jgi:hypothetical protein